MMLDGIVNFLNSEMKCKRAVDGRLLTRYRLVVPARLTSLDTRVPVNDSVG